MTQNRTLSLILPAFGAAIIAALAQIIIPIGAVPITLQTFAVGLVAAVFKPRKLLFLLSSILFLALLVYPFSQEVAVGFNPSLVLQLAIFLPILFCSCHISTNPC